MLIIRMRDFIKDPLTVFELKTIESRINNIGKQELTYDLELELHNYIKLVEKSSLGARLYENGMRVIK